MRKILLILFIAVCTMAFIYSANAEEMTLQKSTQSETLGSYRTLTAAEAKSKIDAGNVTVLDVRSQSEYEEGHIAGSICVPGKYLETTVPALLPDLSEPILVCSRTGWRSSAAAAALAQMGYTNISDMGGLTDWHYGLVR